MTPFLLAILGLILVFLEFYLPGTILGISGSILIIVSFILIIVQTQSALESSLFILGTLVALWAVVKFALWRIPKTKSRFNIYLNSDQEGFQATSYDSSVIGKQGVVLSDLKPGGYILIENKQHQAISQEGYVTKGSSVIVIGGEGDSLIVKKE